MDALSDILKTVRVKGSVYACDQLESPWTLKLSDTTSASFHLVRRGECWVTAMDRTERLGPGDLVFLDPGIDHILTGQPPGEENPVTPGAETLLLCGYCQYRQDIDTPLFASLDPVMVIREQEFLKYPWLKGTLDQISSEYLQQKPGAQMVVDKLTEVVLVEMIRINFGRAKEAPFIKALSHSQISRALQLLHTTPESPWTLESVAAEIGMSRAAFARQFKSLVGKTMFDYLTGLRIQQASELLSDTDLPIHEIASRVGYESEMAFTRTFKKLVDLTPTQFRKDKSRS